MSQNKLYVGNLPYGVDDQALEAMFAPHGTVSTATIIIDKYSNRSKGFGFVEMSSDDEANAAIEALNETEVEGRKVVVSVARPPRERTDG